MSIWLTREPGLLAGKRVLELGAGVGLSGIAAAVAGAAHVTLSDTFETEVSAKLAGGAASECSTAALRGNLAANVRLNGVEDNTEILNLDWQAALSESYQPAETFDVLLGSDVVYEGFAVPALAETLCTHTADGGVAYLMSSTSRFADAKEDLLPRLEAQGTVEMEAFTIHNSAGRVPLVLLTFRKGH